jgi:hypothetical protein
MAFRLKAGGIVFVTVVALSASLLCALVFGALGAPSAFAAKGTTAFTCVEGGGKSDFTDAHCAKSGVGKFGHVEIAPGTATKFTATNEKTASETKASTPAVLSFHMVGVNWAFECTKLSAEGSFVNETGTPMKVTGTAISIALTGCLAAGAALEKEHCVVQNGEIKTPGSLTSTTPTEAMAMEFKSEPGQPIFTFNLVNCKTAALNHVYKVEGTFNAIPEGATLTTTEASTEGLEVAGTPGVDSLTTKMTVRRAPVEGKEQSPLAFTTTEM